MAPRVEAAYAGPDWTPLPAHPVPNRHAYGDNLSNVSSLTVSTGTTKALRATTTLIQVCTDKPIRILAGATGSIASTGYVLMPGYHSFSTPAGASLRLQAVDEAAAVQILEG